MTALDITRLKALPGPEFLRQIVDAFYALPGNIVGGVLHIVLDDFNLETHHVQWCRQEAEKVDDKDAIFLADLLLLYSQKERFDILAPDYITEDDPNDQLDDVLPLPADSLRDIVFDGPDDPHAPARIDATYPLDDAGRQWSSNEGGKPE